jgi:hypothetical protein
MHVSFACPDEAAPFVVENRSESSDAVLATRACGAAQDRDRLCQAGRQPVRRRWARIVASGLVV